MCQFCAEDGGYYLVWEQTEGETLAEAVRARGQFGEGQAVAILKQVLDALAYLHEQSPPVIHGAIRPSNLVMTSSGTVVLTGFGSVQEAVTNAPILNMGSEESDYVAPEQQRGETSPSSDLYALAATTVFLLTGRKLGTNPQSEVSHAAGDGPRSSPVSHVVSELTTLQPSVRQALTKMLEVSVTTRVARADEVLADLGAVRVPEPIVVDRSRTVSIPALDMTRAEPSRHRENDATTGQVSRRGTWSLVSVGVVAIIALVIWASSLVRSPDQRPAGGVSTPPAAPVPPQSPPTTGITPPAVAPPVTPEAPSPPRPKPKVASRPRSPSAPAGETPQVAPPTSTTSPAAPVVEGPKPPAEPKGGESPALHDETSRLFLAPFDRVWTTTESALKNLGWDIDKRERTQGYILTESRSLDKDNFGVWEKSLRHRLRLQLKASGSNQTLVTVERTIFKRQRVMWVNTDTPVESDSRLGHKAEQAVLAEIARAL